MRNSEFYIPRSNKLCNSESQYPKKIMQNLRPFIRYTTNFCRTSRNSRQFFMFLYNWELQQRYLNKVFKLSLFVALLDISGLVNTNIADLTIKVVGFFTWLAGYFSKRNKYLAFLFLILPCLPPRKKCSYSEFSGPYFPAFGLNTKIYSTFHAVYFSVFYAENCH